MKHYQLSNKDAETLDRIINYGNFKSPEAVLKHLIQSYACELIQPQRGVMDLQPACNGAYKTQKDWIELYNSQQGEFRGKRMISSPDVIKAPEHALPEALASLQKDCREAVIITSTHNRFKPDIQYKPLAGNVIHNYQSRIVTPKIISLDEIPVLQGEPADKVVGTIRGLAYVRALADNRYAKPAKLLKLLVALSQREPENIAFWTPDQNLRKQYPEWAVRFYDFGDWFLVYGVSDFGNVSGRSRGVLINSSPRRSGQQKK